MIALHDFIGTWQLARRIVEDAGRQARFEGTARFARMDGAAGAAGALLLHEEGTLYLPGQDGLHATRRFTWWPGRDGRVEVRFDDGRPFHVFDPNRAECTDRHWCDPDTYVVRYDFSRWPEWSARWRVDGPRKGYTMHSRYLIHAPAGA